MKNYARWKDIFHYGFGYTACPYCGDETPWYNPVSTKFQSALENNRCEYCPKCGNRVYSREGWIINQPPEVEEDERKAIESTEPADVVSTESQEIGYDQCANAMLKMWMDNVVTDGEYNRIMDRLNKLYFSDGEREE